MKRLTRFALASLSLASLSLALPALAYAQDGFVTGNVNLRAGPDPSYPLVDQLPAGTGVSVQGCTDGWEWCDVINDNDGNRGWIAGNFIQYDYQDQPVLLSDYGAQIGIPIVAFTIGTYWDHYYRERPFYRERETWYHRDIPRRPPPRPMDRDRPYEGRPMSHDDRQRHGSNENRQAPQYQRPAQVGEQPQHENNAQRYGANENRPAPQYQHPAQAGAQPQHENNAQRYGASENRPAPQYQRAQPASVPQQRGPNPGARPQQQAAPARGEAQAHGGHEAKPAEHKKDDHADNGGH